jgi:NADH-quinone oxidoreductase subunit M
VLAGLGRPLAVLAALGTALAAVYLLRVLRRVWHGPAEPRWLGAAMGDVTRHELVVTSPLVVATAALGVLPWLLLDVTGPAVRALLGAAGAP